MTLQYRLLEHTGIDLTVEELLGERDVRGLAVLIEARAEAPLTLPERRRPG